MQLFLVPEILDLTYLVTKTWIIVTRNIGMGESQCIERNNLE